MTLRLKAFGAAMLLALAGTAGMANDAIEPARGARARRCAWPGACLSDDAPAGSCRNPFRPARGRPLSLLEDDARADPDVATWIASQNHVTENYLAGLPGREALRARMTNLYDYERYGHPPEGRTALFLHL